MSEWLNPQTLIGVFTLVTGLILALVAWRKEARTAPIEKDTNSVTQANQVTEMTVGAYKELYERLTDTLVELDELRSMVKKWDSWYHNLLIKWGTYQKADGPPSSPKETNSVATK